MVNVNWEQQWSLFTPGFKEGFAHIELGAKVLRLQPGAGFGDLSHPTTRLMLEHLKLQAKDQTVLDIGCGSGILTLAALALGAKKAIGIDIDNEALTHARQNAKLNNLKAQFTRPETYTVQPSSLILMNMISSEQMQAYNPHYPASHIITSGILLSQREAYLHLAHSWNWELLETTQEEEWLAFLFKRIRKRSGTHAGSGAGSKD